MNPREMYLQQLNRRCLLDGGAEYLEMLRYPKEVLELSFPCGSTRRSENFQRVAEPSQQRSRPYREESGTREVSPMICRSSSWMTTSVPLPASLRRSKGASLGCPRAFADELENLSRAYAFGISFVGTDYDIPAPDVVHKSPVMAWFLDTFEKVKGWSEPSAFTGKPVVMGGSLGRSDSTGKGGIFISGKP